MTLDLNSCSAPGCRKLGKPKGTAIAMPAIPIRRSAIKDAALSAASYFNWMAPARRTTSPPIVVGKKFEENNPANVTRVISQNEVLAFAERNNTYQRAETAIRETIIRTIARIRRQAGMSANASPI